MTTPAPPALRHYRYAQVAASTQEAVTPAVPAGRAFVVSKVTAARRGAAATSALSLSIGSTGGTPGNVVNGLSVALGEQYAETGLVLEAGERLFVFASEAGSFDVNVFGEEVGN